MENKINNKLILSCSKHGVVKQIFLDTGSLLEKIKLPTGLHGLVSPISLNELGSFWLAIQKNSIEEPTQLTLRFEETQFTYKFSGYLLKDTVLLCGTTEMTPTDKVLEEIMLINSEQANQIRLTQKKADITFQKSGDAKMHEGFLNDFTSLNNELVNNKRELIRKNQKIEFLNNELKVANDNLSMFTYSVSHDLKEPVRMVKSFLTLLQKKYGDLLDSKGQTYMDFAQDGAHRLNEMITDLLAYHQSSDLSTSETVDLNTVLMEVRQILHSEIAAKKAIVNHEKLPIILGSHTGYRQVFQNLISNAVKFVPKGKTPIISIRADENDTNFILSVTDNGIGIAENQIKEVFNLFKRLNSSQEYEGTGMGLAMVKKSIEKMGGTVWMESEENKGSSVYFTTKKL